MSEWKSEHLCRLSATQQPAWQQPKERLRQAIHFRTVVAAELRQTRQKSTAGGAKLLFCLFKDACHKRDEAALTRQRTRAEFLAHMKSLYDLFESLPDTDPEKHHFQTLYQQRLQHGRLGREYLQSEECISDILDKLAESRRADWVSDPASAMGIGCKRFPLSPDLLKASMDDAGTTSLRKMCPGLCVTL